MPNNTNGTVQSCGIRTPIHFPQISHEQTSGYISNNSVSGSIIRPNSQPPSPITNMG